MPQGLEEKISKRLQEELEEHMLTVKAAPGNRGQGLFANRSIADGETILQATAMLFTELPLVMDFLRSHTGHADSATWRVHRDSIVVFDRPLSLRFGEGSVSTRNPWMLCTPQVLRIAGLCQKGGGFGAAHLRRKGGLPKGGGGFGAAHLRRKGGLPKGGGVLAQHICVEKGACQKGVGFKIRSRVLRDTCLSRSPFDSGKVQFPPGMHGCFARLRF